MITEEVRVTVRRKNINSARPQEWKEMYSFCHTLEYEAGGRVQAIEVLKDDIDDTPHGISLRKRGRFAVDYVVKSLATDT